MQALQSDSQNARDRLREWLKPGDTLYTILRYVSRSGMMRRISVVQPYIRKDTGEIDFRPLDYNVALAMEWPEGRNRLRGYDGIEVGGCGMDMGFHLVYSLSSILWPHGYKCIGVGCPANDHVNARGAYCAVCGADLGSTSGDYCRGRYPVCSVACKSAPWVHRDGGYALQQRWL